MNNDSAGDHFQSFKKDPRLSVENVELNERLPQSSLLPDLKARLKSCQDKQDFYDNLRLFKREELARITKWENEPLKNRWKILSETALVAETILIAAYEYIRDTLGAEIGIPSWQTSYQQTAPAHLAVVGMGKLGTGEMDYESDLDLIFIFSHLGEVIGKKKLGNHEYFIKFAQKLIQLLAIITGAGRCYAIDVELRPSGQAGPLVSSFDHFLEHQMNRAQEWERLALLRARPIVAPKSFLNRLNSHLDELAFKAPLPTRFFPTMHAIRQRVLRERLQEPDNSFDLKLGQGGLMDIDFVLLGLQLKYQLLYPDLRQRSLKKLIEAFSHHSILSKAEITGLSEAHLLYRTLIAQLQLKENRAVTLLRFDADACAESNEKLGFSNKKELQEKLVHLKNQVQTLYRRYYETT